MFQESLVEAIGVEVKHEANLSSPCILCILHKLLKTKAEATFENNDDEDDDYDDYERYDDVNDNDEDDDNDDEDYDVSTPTSAQPAQVT